MKNKEFWKTVIQIIVTVLTALKGGELGEGKERGANRRGRSSYCIRW